MKRILVIDDEPTVARLIRAALEAAGVEHILDYCSDGAQGRTKAAQGQYDLITLDLHMPLMGGVEALREMKQNPKSADIPVVVITAQKDPTFHQRATQFGTAAVITKPFQVKELGSILARILVGEQFEQPLGVDQDPDLRSLDT